MTEYQKILDAYKSEYYLLYNTFLTEKDWGNYYQAEKYLQKYWLSNAEYNETIVEIQNRIFDSSFESLPQKVFLPEFEIIPNIGGVLFEEKDFEALKKCFDKTGDSYFYIVQNNLAVNGVPKFRLKYPTKTTWNELISGNYLSTFLFEMFHNEYFVFGNSGLWGKYCSNDEDLPIDIYGVTENLVSVFLNNFEDIRVINPDQIITDSNPHNLKTHHITLSEVKDSLPNSYKEIYKIN